MAFEIASTNLVVELGVIMALLMGWQFTAAEFVGGPLMIVALAVLFRLLLRERLLRQAREQAERGLAGSMEGHAAMDMSVRSDAPFLRRLLSRDGFTATAHVFVMEWAAIIRDLVVGLLIAGAVAAWVPESFWRAFFFVNDPLAAKVRSLLRRDYNFSRTPGRHYSVPCVFSTEQLRYPKPDGSVCQAKGFVGEGVKLDCAGGFGAVMMVTATFGMAAAARAVDKLVAGARRPSERSAAGNPS